MTLKHHVKDRMLRSMNVAHGALLGMSRGRIGATLSNMAVYRVTTTGRTSGQPRTVLLTVPVRDEDRYVFVASKGGDDRDPDWYRNMLAHPEFRAEPVNGGDVVHLIARAATTEEKAELWPDVVAAYKGYQSYQDSTTRDIPLVIAEPAPRD